MSKNLIIIGAGGHAKVVSDIALKLGYSIDGILDDDETLIGKNVLQHKVLGKVEECKKYSDKCEFVIAIGNNYIREKISKQYKLKWATLIHPSAILGIDVSIEEGTVVMPNVVINASSKIGRHCIINTATVVEHDNVIEDYVHISPGVHIAGTVRVGTRTHVGIGATVINNICVGSDIVIGAGAVVIISILEKDKYIGCPAKKMC